MIFQGGNLFAAMDAMQIGGIVILVLLLGVLFVYPSLSSKKRRNHIVELYKSVEVGDTIKTVGGIIGTVIEVREINAVETEIVVESGIGERKTTLVFDIQALYQNLTKMGQPVIAPEPNSENADEANIVEEPAAVTDESTETEGK